MAIGHPKLTLSAGLGKRISAPRPPNRLRRLRDWMTSEALDACVAFGARNITHLAGYSRYHAGPCGVVIRPDGERTLVVMRDERSVAVEVSAADDVRAYGERGFGLILDPRPLLANEVAAVLHANQVRRFGVCDEIGGMGALLNAVCDAKQVDAAAQLDRIRLIKDEDELVHILRSYELCWIGQDAVASGIRGSGGVSEIELYTAAQAGAQNAHGAPIEFVTDLLSGPNVADVCYPIQVAGTRIVEAGDGVIADVVVGANGYWGDTAETHIAGENAEISEMRKALLEILAAASRDLQPGNTGAAVFAGMRSRILAEFEDGEFPHHGGHGVGLTAFDDPHVIPSDDSPLESWMVIALEPGVYFPGRTGARVEKLFVVTAEGGVELRDALGAR